MFKPSASISICFGVNDLTDTTATETSYTETVQLHGFLKFTPAKPDKIQHRLETLLGQNHGILKM